MAQWVSGHVSLSILENRTQKHPKINSLQIFKNENFCISQFSQNFSIKKFPFYGAVGFLTCFSIDPRKSHSKIPKTHLSTAFWIWHSWKVSKIQAFVFLNFFEMFFSTHAWVPQIASHVCISYSILWSTYFFKWLLFPIHMRK